MEINENILARVYSFDLQFKGSRRTHFYRKLYGFKSRTTREDKEGREKVYENFYPGLLTSLPHLRLGKSVIAVPKTAKGKVDAFFEDPKWDSIDLHPFDGLLPREDRLRAMKEVLGRIRVTWGESLRSEIRFLSSQEAQGQLGSEEVQRARGVLVKAEELMKHDWTDDKEFSKYLSGEIKPIREWID